jgi:hypothetical protein
LFSILPIINGKKTFMSQSPLEDSVGLQQVFVSFDSGTIMFFLQNKVGSLASNPQPGAGTCIVSW